MNVYEPEDSLMGSYLFFSFDLNVTAILEGISFLAFDNVNIMLGSHNFQFEKFETEFWFDINYTSEEFPSSWPHFSQSSNCDFITDFEISPTMHALLYLYCFSFTFLYQEKIYEAEMANITFVWNLQIFGGVSFHFEGYENKIDTLIYYIFDKFLSFNLDEDMFLRLKTKIINNWNNSLQKQHKYIKNLIYHLLCRNSKTIMDLLEELKTLTYSHFINFQNNFKSLHMFVDLLVCGCISSHKAKSILEKVINKLNAPVLEFKQFSRLHFIDLPIGSCLYRIPSKVKSDKMVTVCNIYQFGIVSYDVYCAIVILNVIMFWKKSQHLLAPLVFKILRDQEQLGYDVYAQLSFAHHVPSIALVVVSDVNKNTPNFIDQRIENLIDNFINSLSLMSESDFKRKASEILFSFLIIEMCNVF
ncbi:hypothetical protein HZS_5139 [Henneguya salminicola]|nr:hypothetical protein HZS_5139 [Henneguya salminicola]